MFLSARGGFEPRPTDLKWGTAPSWGVAFDPASLGLAIGQDPVQTWAVILAAAFIPSLIYVAVLRNSERFDRQSWGSVLVAFLYGAVVSVVLVIVVQLLFGSYLNRFLAANLSLSEKLIPVVVAAPLVEELFKGGGLKHFRGRTRAVEDGIIYAAAIALGFAATENLMYQGAAFLQGGFTDWWNVVVARSVSSSLMHPTATGLIGLGYGKMVVNGTSRIRLLPYYGGAVLLHAVYNYAAVTGLVITPGVPLHLPVAVLMAVGGFVLLRHQIVRWDRPGAPAA